MTPEKAENRKGIWTLIAVCLFGIDVFMFFKYGIERVGLGFALGMICWSYASRWEGWREGYLAAQPGPQPARCTCAAFSPSSVTVNGAPTCRYCGLLP